MVPSEHVPITGISKGRQIIFRKLRDAGVQDRLNEEEQEVPKDVRPGTIHPTRSNIIDDLPYDQLNSLLLFAQ